MQDDTLLDSLVHCKPIHALEPNRIIRRKTIQCFCDRTDKVIQMPLLVYSQYKYGIKYKQASL